MIDREKERRSAILIVIGLMLAIAGFVMLVMGFLASPVASAFGQAKAAGTMIAVWFLMMVVGIGMVVVPLLSGYRKGAKLSRDKVVRTESDVRIMSRYAYDREQIMQFPTDPDPNLPYKYYVLVQFASGQQYEFRTNLGNYFTCGEGLKGTIQYQGDWLGSFQPVIERQELPPDPYAR